MSLQARTQGLGLAVDEGLRGVLALGLLEAEGVMLGTLPPEFAAERDQITARMSARLSGKQPADIPGVAETRALFHQLDLDPTKTRPSSEALLRRVLQGKGLPQVNAAVDVCNLCSLEDQIPLGLYDRAHVKGSIRARVGRESEGYEGIRKPWIHLTGRFLLADEVGLGKTIEVGLLIQEVLTTSPRLRVLYLAPARLVRKDFFARRDALARVLREKHIVVN